MGLASSSLGAASGGTPVGPTGGQQVEGTQAAGAIATSNPISTALQVRGPSPSYANNALAIPRIEPTGMQYMCLGTPFSANYALVNAANTPTVTPNSQVVYTGAFQYLFDGSNFLRASGSTVGASVVLKPEATGGALMAKIISAASTNATAIKAAASSVVGIDVYNSGAAVCFLKLYNKASAPVVGTDIPVKVIAIPPGAPREINRPLAEAFTVGLAYAITTGFADADTGAVAAGQVTGSIDYA